MQIAMQQRLRGREIAQAEMGDRALQRDVGAQRRGPGRERGRDLVAPDLDVRVGEDEIDRDPLQREVLRKERDVGGLALERNREVGGMEGRLRHEFRDVLGRLREALARDQPLAQDDVRLELLHHDHELLGIVGIEFGREPASHGARGAPDRRPRSLRA